MGSPWVGLVAVLIGGLSMAQTVPELVNYQGKLMDASGEALATKDYSLTFRVYSAASGGTELWGPQVFDGDTGAGHGPQVPVVKGFFNVILGPSDTAGRTLSTAFSSQSAYLEIQVDDAPALQPHQQILSAPYALRAARADRADRADNGGPVGTIVAFHTFDGKTSVPDGWVVCDGRDITEGPLAGSKTPNLMNRFLMGNPTSGQIGGSNELSASTSTGYRNGGTNLNLHTHELPFTDGGANGVSLIDTPHDRGFGVGSPSSAGMPHGYFQVSWQYPAGASYLRSRTTYVDDLNSHTHSLSLNMTVPAPDYFTVIYIVRIK